MVDTARKVWQAPPPGRTIATFERPRFKSPQAYVECVEAVLRDGGRPWPPATRQELELSIERFPAWTRANLPPVDVLIAMGLPGDFGKDPEPFPSAWVERFIVTIEQNDDLRRALAYLLKRGGR